jgi:type 1 fimbria pilin
VPASEHCSIANGGLILTSTLVDLGTIGGETYALFSPDHSTTFVEITFEGCKQTALNATFSIKGEAVALMSNPGLLIFKEGAPNNKLKFAGNSATLIAEDLVLMEGTGALIEAL